MEYSAAGVKFLLWFIETRETIRLLQDNTMDEAKTIIYENNIYQQKSKARQVSEFSCIKRRIEAIPDELAKLMLNADVNTAKLIALISAMAADRILFELVYEVYRNKLYMGETEFKDSDLNIFFTKKAEQSDVVASWTEATVKKLKQTYTKYFMEAGLIQKIDKNEKKVMKPYIDLELRNTLLASGMEKYLFALTGER